MAVRGFVDALTDERIVHIRQRNDLRRNRDFVPHQTIGIAVPIIALVVPAANVAGRAHQLLVVVRRKVVEHLRAKNRVLLHLLELFRRQLSGFIQNFRVNGDFTNIVHRRRKGNQVAVLRGQAVAVGFGTQHLQKPLRQLPHMLHMRAVLTVPELHHMAQDVNQQHVVLFFFEDLARDH